MRIESLNEKIKTTPALMLYFSSSGCGVCEILKPKIFKAFDINYPKIEKIEIDADLHKEIAAHFRVFALPTVIIFFDGKEFARKSRNISVDGFIDDFKRVYNLFFN